MTKTLAQMLADVKARAAAAELEKARQYSRRRRFQQVRESIRDQQLLIDPDFEDRL